MEAEKLPGTAHRCVKGTEVLPQRNEVLPQPERKCCLGSLGPGASREASSDDRRGGDALAEQHADVSQ